MYKSYFKRDGKTYALDKKGKFNIIKTTDNVEEILITKNNIEEIENLIKEVNNNQISNKDTFNISKNLTIIIDIVSILLLIIPSALPLKFVLTLIFVFININFAKDNNNYIKNNNEYLNKNEILEKMLTLEKEKLNVLEKNAKEIEYVENTKEKSIDTSEKIKELYKKLELINYYIQNYYQIHYLYNSYGENCLRNKLKDKYSREEINFIIILINKIELKRKNNVENNKVKKL